MIELESEIVLNSYKKGGKMNITQIQRDILKEYKVKIFNNVNDTLSALDDKITEIGFNADYSLNSKGLKLQRLYDELYNQN